MRDRLPELGKENRIRITMDDGQAIEGVLSYADMPVRRAVFIAREMYCRMQCALRLV